MAGVLGAIDVHVGSRRRPLHAQVGCATVGGLRDDGCRVLRLSDASPWRVHHHSRGPPAIAGGDAAPVCSSDHANPSASFMFFGFVEHSGHSQYVHRNRSTSSYALGSLGFARFSLVTSAWGPHDFKFP